MHNFGTLPGRPRLLHFDDVNYLLRLVRLRPDWFLAELLGLLKTNRFISVHYVTIHRELCRAHVSLKKLKKIASERMKTSGMTTLNVWPNMNLTNWALSMKPQRMTKPLLEAVVIQRRVTGLS